MSIIEIIVAFLERLFGSKDEGPTASKGPQPSAPDDRPQAISFANYYARESVLSAAENRLASVVAQVVPADVHVLTRIRVEDVINVRKKGRTNSEIASDRGRIKSRHFDFLLVNRGYAPIAIIELDDSSHRKASAQKADQFKNDLCVAVGIPLIRVPASPPPDANRVAALLANLEF